MARLGRARPQRHIIVEKAVAAAAQVVGIGQATETDLAQGISWAPKHRLISQTVETDLSQPLTVVKIKAIGQATETDLAQPLTRVKTVILGQALETDLAQPLTRIKTLAVAQATETDTAQAITWDPKHRLINQATETDLAQTLTVVKTLALGQAVETDTAQTISWAPKHRLVNQVTETDLAQSISVLAALPVVIRRGPEGLARPYFFAYEVSAGQTFTVGQATETDLAQSVSWAPKSRQIGQATETDTAQPLDVFAGVIEIRHSKEGIGRGFPPFPVTAPQHFVSQAQETDEALPIGDIRFGLSGLTAMGIRRKYLSIPPSPTISPQTIPVAQAVETDEAFQLVMVYTAFETDVALPISRPRVGALVPWLRRRRRTAKWH